MSTKLSEYLQKNSISYAAFARQVGATGPGVKNWARGRRPSEPFMTRIKRVTNGAITAADFPDAADDFIPPASAPIGFESGPPVAAHPPDPPP